MGRPGVERSSAWNSKVPAGMANPPSPDAKGMVETVPGRRGVSGQKQSAHGRGALYSVQRSTHFGQIYSVIFQKKRNNTKNVRLEKNIFLLNFFF